MCVGGGTTINNAVCFDPARAPCSSAGTHARARPRAAARGVRRGARVGCAWREIRRRRVTQRRREAVRARADALGLRATSSSWRRNIADGCLGSRLLQHRLRVRQEALGARLDPAAGPARLPGAAAHPARLPRRAGRSCAATARRACRRGTATARLTVHADAVVVAAGALASSVTAPAQRPRRRTRRPRAGLQHQLAAHRRLPRGAALVRGAADRTPTRAAATPATRPRARDAGSTRSATQALSMPGWFERTTTTCAATRTWRAPACWSAPPTPRRSGRAASVTADDRLHARRARTSRGSRRASSWPVGSGSTAGATRVLPATFACTSALAEATATARHAIVRRHADLLLTSRPSAGRQPDSANARKGVVDPDFRVHGTQNLYVCDAQRVPVERHRQPAAHRHGAGPVRLPPPARLADARSSSSAPGRSARRWRGGSRAAASASRSSTSSSPATARATSGGETRLIRCAHGADADYTAMARRARTLWRELEAESGARPADRVRRRVVRARRGRLGGGVRARRMARAGHPGRAARRRGGARGCSRASAATTSRGCCYEPEAGVLRAQQAVQTLAAQAVRARRAARAGRARARTATRSCVGRRRAGGRPVVWACGGWLRAALPASS